MDQEQKMIHDVIKGREDGISLRELSSQLSSPLPYRTLQRRIDSLIDANLIERHGSGPRTRYFVKSSDSPSRIFDISSAGRDIILKVTKPLKARAATHYNPEFLNKYVPNKTFYLSATDRKVLFEMGSMPKDHRPAGTFAKQIYHSFLVDLSWNSSRLEGNTYSLLETEQLLTHNVQAEDKSPFETQMIMNHKAAIDFLLDNIKTVGFDGYTIRNLHALLANNLLPDPGACGRLRSIAVGIGGTPYKPTALPQVLENSFQLLLKKAAKIKDPFEQAFFVLVHLPYLQPFEDVNKRTSRLAANIPFIKNNLTPLSFIEMPEDLYIHAILGVYELNHIELLRDVFMWNYVQSAKRYSSSCQQATEPNLFKLQHTAEIKQIIQTVVRKKLSKSQAAKTVAAYAKEHLAQNIQAQFIEAVETELIKLTLGNSARFAITANEFNTWHKNWA